MTQKSFETRAKEIKSCTIMSPAIYSTSQVHKVQNRIMEWAISAYKAWLTAVQLRLHILQK